MTAIALTLRSAWTEANAMLSMRDAILSVMQSRGYLTIAFMVMSDVPELVIPRPVA